MSRENLRSEQLAVTGILETERLQVSGAVTTYALAWLDQTTAPLALVGTEARSRYIASKRDVDGVADRIVPVGTVVMWAGSAAAVPQGWALCDGTNGTPDLRGTFPLGIDPDEAPDRASRSPTEHSAVLPLPQHSHQVASAPGSSQTGSNAHAHRFTEKVIDGLVTDPTTRTEWSINPTRWFRKPEGFITTDAGTDTRPLATAWDPTRTYGTESATLGTRAQAAGGHSHTVSARHSHPTANAGTQAEPRVDIQPEYATVHFIMKVSYAEPQASRCPLPDEPPCEDAAQPEVTGPPVNCVMGPWRCLSVTDSEGIPRVCWPTPAPGSCVEGTRMCFRSVVTPAQNGGACPDADAEISTASARNQLMLAWRADLSVRTEADLASQTLEQLITLAVQTFGLRGVVGAANRAVHEEVADAVARFGLKQVKVEACRPTVAEMRPPCQTHPSCSFVKRDVDLLMPANWKAGEPRFVCGKCALTGTYQPTAGVQNGQVTAADGPCATLLVPTCQSCRPSDRVQSNLPFFNTATANARPQYNYNYNCSVWVQPRRKPGSWQTRNVCVGTTTLPTVST
jgi:hypothetical protein